jgi:hypothetical protein
MKDLKKLPNSMPKTAKSLLIRLNKWIEHYYKLYSKINEVSNEALDSIPQYPVLEYLDDEPTPQELNRAIDALLSKKAPGKDIIAAEHIK